MDAEEPHRDSSSIEITREAVDDLLSVVDVGYDVPVITEILHKLSMHSRKWQRKKNGWLLFSSRLHR